MKQYENDVERYLDEIRQLLPDSKERKEHFLETFAENIVRHEEEVGATVDYEELVTYFGTPATIAKDYAIAWEDELTDTRTVTVSHVPWKKIVIGLCVLLVFIVAISLFGGFLMTSFTYGDGYAMFER